MTREKILHHGPWKIWNIAKLILKGHGISVKFEVIKNMTHEKYFMGIKNAEQIY